MTKKPFQEILGNENIMLRRLDQTDSGAMFRIVNDNRDVFRLWLNWVDNINSEGDMRQYIQCRLDLWTELAMFTYTIHDRNKNMAGMISLKNIAWEHQRAEFVAWRDQSDKFRGLGTEAVKLLSCEAFSAGFHRLEIRCDTRHPSSPRVAQKAGFSLEATLKAYERYHLSPHNYIDWHIFVKFNAM